MIKEKPKCPYCKCYLFRMRDDWRCPKCQKEFIDTDEDRLNQLMKLEPYRIINLNWDSNKDTWQIYGKRK